MATPVNPLPGEAVLDEPVAPVVPAEEDPGTPPAAEPAAEPQATPPTPSDADDTPPGGTDDEDPEEWRYLADRFHKLEGDDKAFKKEVGRTFLEKQRYATEQRERADGLARENEELRAEREAKPKEPPQPHPDVERVSARITRLEKQDETYYERQQTALIAIAQCNEQAAVAKHQASEADEDNRAYYEDQAARLVDRKTDLQDRFKDLQEKRVELSFQLEDSQDQRNWTEEVVKQQATREVSERKDRAVFDESFPADVTREVARLATGLKIEDVDHEALKDFVLPRLTVQFWKLGQSDDLDNVNWKALVETEVHRWHKTQDTKARAVFRRDSEKRLAGRTPPASPKPPPPETTPPGPSVPHPTGVKEVTALGLQDVDPKMAKGRAYLDTKGL